MGLRDALTTHAFDFFCDMLRRLMHDVRQRLLPCCHPSTLQCSAAPKPNQIQAGALDGL
jgi:hypothetical protein